jgi:tetraacyldisaccharide-1-P 4'-kinase
LVDNQNILDERTKKLKDYHNILAKDFEDKMQIIYCTIHDLIKLIETAKDMVKGGK